MADLATIEQALRNADAAGDAQAATALAGEYNRVKASSPAAGLPPMYDDATKKFMASQYGMGDKLTTALGLGDVGQKLQSGAMGLLQGGLIDPVMGRGLHIGDRYNEDLGVHRDVANQYAQANPVKSAIGTAAGTVLALPMLPTVGSGVTGAMASGAGYGALSGAFSDADTLQGRAVNTLVDGGIGGLLGLGLGAGVKYGPRAVKALGAPIMARINPEGVANSVLANAADKAGQSASDLQNAVTQAAAEGQPMFTTADALGSTGQSLLSTVARSPNDMQAVIADKMLGRQVDQSGRVGGFVKDALNANQTADQAVTSLTNMRGRVANVNYDMARNAGGPVDLSDTINTIDSLVGPQAKYNVGINPDSTEGALLNIRARLATGGAKGQTSRTDFQDVLRQKSDLKDTIDALYRAGKNNQANALKAVYDKLDSALEAASPAYRAANDTFAKMSRPIDAVPAGSEAARPSARAADTIDAFNQLDPHSQSAFKVGYADPLLGRIENAPYSANVARPLLGQKNTAEFGAMAKDPALLNRQLTRENTMNATMQRALGGSKTADNILNEAELSNVSPGELFKAMRGGVTGLLGLALSKGADTLTGRTPQVRALLGERLLSNDPASYLTKLQAQRLAGLARQKLALKAIGPISGLLGGNYLH